MADHISVLRHALAAIWTELEKDAPDPAACQDIAGEALALTRQAAGRGKVPSLETGVEGWREFLQRREARVIREELAAAGRDAPAASFCCRTKSRVGSDHWWEEQQAADRCACHPCGHWCETHSAATRRISWDEMNEITVEVALLLERRGVEGYQYRECMNVLRRGLQDSFEMNSLNYDPMLGGGDWTVLRKTIQEKHGQAHQADHPG